MREMWNFLCSVDQECKWDCEEEGQTGMFPNRLWADWQKYLYCYVSGTVLATIESRWYCAETHCEQGPGCACNSQWEQISTEEKL